MVGGSYIRRKLNSMCELIRLICHVVDVEEADNALRANIVATYYLFLLNAWAERVGNHCILR